MSPAPDNGEIVARIDALREDVQEIKQHDLQEIKEQTKLTNGRVSKLELWQARIEGAHSAFSWLQPTLSGLIVGVILGILHFT